MPNNVTKSDNPIFKATSGALSAENFMEAAGIETPIVSKFEKESLAARHTPLWIHDVELLAGDFTSNDNPEGYYWSLSITIYGSEKIRKMGMSYNKDYETFYVRLQQAFEAGVEKVGPWQLEKIHSKRSGFDFYTLSSVTELPF